MSTTPMEYPADNQPLLTIIIVSWQVKAMVLDCIQSIYEQTRLPDYNYQIFLVDNDSSDGTVDAVSDRFPNVKTIHNTNNVGFGAANNQAYQITDSDYVLLLNPDTLLLDDAIDRLLEHSQQNPDIAVLGCRLLNEDHSLQRWTAGAFPNLANAAAHYLFLNKFLPKSHKVSPLYMEHDIPVETEVDWLCGACLMLRREHVGDTIFSSDFFMYGEDMELCFRMKKSGHKVVYYPDVSIVHFQGKSMEQQQGDILLHALKGPRNFYTSIHGSSFTALFDLIATGGFLIRTLVFGLLSLISPKNNLTKAKSSFRYLKIASKVLIRSK